MGNSKSKAKLEVATPLADDLLDHSRELEYASACVDTVCLALQAQNVDTSEDIRMTLLRGVQDVLCAELGRLDRMRGVSRTVAGGEA